MTHSSENVASFLPRIHSAEGIDVTAAQEALAALIPEIEHLAAKVDSIFRSFAQDIREGKGDSKEGSERVERVRFSVFLGILGVYYQLTEQIITAMQRVAKSKDSEPAGETKSEAADSKAEKKSVAKSLTKAQLWAKLRATQQEVDRLDHRWETSLNGLAKLLRILAKSSGFVSFLEQGGLLLGASSYPARENGSEDRPEAVTSADILAFLKT